MNRKEYEKLYREKYKDEITEKSERYYMKNIEKVKLKNRLYYLEHRDELNQKAKENYDKKGGKFITSFDILGDDAVITKIENFKCNDLKDLWKREAEIIQQFGNSCANKTFNEMND